MISDCWVSLGAVLGTAPRFSHLKPEQREQLAELFDEALLPSDHQMTCHTNGLVMVIAAGSATVTDTAGSERSVGPGEVIDPAARPAGVVVRTCTPVTAWMASGVRVALHLSRCERTGAISS